MRLIDADALKEQCFKFSDDVPRRAMAFAQGQINCAPTLDPEELRPKAEWKHYHKQNIAVCTNCSFERDLGADFGKAISCPNCGADMRGKVKDDT